MQRIITLAISLLYLSICASGSGVINKEDLDITIEELRDRKIVTQGGLQFNPIDSDDEFNRLKHTGYTSFAIGNILPWNTKKLHYVTYGMTLTISGMKKTENTSLLSEAKGYDNYSIKKGYDAYLGSFVNYHIAVSKVFRPGILLGFGYRREYVEHSSGGGGGPFVGPVGEVYTYREYLDWNLKPILGLSFQFGPVYTTVSTHEGFGIGICSGMKKRIIIHNSINRKQKTVEKNEGLRLLTNVSQ